MDDEPHAVSDDEPAGEPAQSSVTVRRKKMRTIMTSVDFDDVLKVQRHMY